MPIIAKLNYLRIAPRKVRLVADLIRGVSAEKAQNILKFTTKRGAGPIFKLLKSALANAKNNFQLEEQDLYVSKIVVDEGPRNKRWRARARGQAAQIQKRTSHITIVLGEIKKQSKEVIKAERFEEKGKTDEIEENGPKKVEKNRKIPKTEKFLEKSKISTERVKFRPESKKFKPKVERGIKRIFKRKAF